jgi:hypothetical protein
MEPGEIDPVRYGVLWERVQNMDKKIDKMEGQIAEIKLRYPKPLSSSGQVGQNTSI